MTPKDQLRELLRGTVNVHSEAELLKKLESGRPLRAKLGVDPSSPDIHLGHTVVLRKLRQFQDLGHQAVLIIGDFTALVGDPTGKKKTRPQLTPDEVEKNARTYVEQVGRVLRPDRLEVVRNSAWLKPLPFYELVKLAAKMTVARFLERDDFSKRLKEGVPISLHEFLYLVMQAYDSVVVKADVELGGTDQLFNLMVGRDLMRDEGMEPQVALTTPILTGLDGKDKMSKSLGNYVGITDPPDEMFGKLMSISDELMWRYYELLSFLPMAEIARRRAEVAGGRNPRDAKFDLAMEIVERFHGKGSGARARDEFIARFQQGAMPESMPEVTVPALDGHVGLAQALKSAGLVASTSEAMRQIRQGAVRVDGERVEDPGTRLAAGTTQVVQVGKRRFARISVAQ